MSQKNRIAAMETILDRHTDILNTLNHALADLEGAKADYDRLLDYYHSDLWLQDLQDDDQGKIDPGLKRGVLSEDAIYNLHADYHSTATRMLRTATDFFESN